MRCLRWKRTLQLVVPGALLLQFGGCLGPNPGFFIGTSIANATIATLVNAFWSNLLGLGGG